MDLIERAKQFAPYDALDGFFKVIKKQEEIKEAPIYLAEDEQSRLNDIFCELQVGDEISVKYYSHNKYMQKEGKLKHIDNYKKLIQFEDDVVIRFREIINIVI